MPYIMSGCRHCYYSSLRLKHKSTYTRSIITNVEFNIYLCISDILIRTAAGFTVQTVFFHWYAKLRRVIQADLYISSVSRGGEGCTLLDNVHWSTFKVHTSLVHRWFPLWSGIIEHTHDYLRGIIKCMLCSVTPTCWL